MKNNSFFTVRNSSLFLLLISFFFSFSSPEKKSSHQQNKSQKEKTFSKQENVLPKAREENNNSFTLENSISTKNASLKIAQHKNLSFPFMATELDGNDEGFIGVNNIESGIDDPSDNIFDIYLNQFDNGKRYVLEYTVLGLHNASSITRSINKSISLGGYITTESAQWNTIQEFVDPSLLKNGKNQILFNVNSPKTSYRIKDVKIKQVSRTEERELVISASAVVGDKLYLRGFLSSAQGLDSLRLQQTNVHVINNEFEFFGEYDPTQKIILSAKRTDGTIINEVVKISDEEGNQLSEKFKTLDKNLIYSEDQGMLLGLRKMDLPPVDPSITNVGKDFFGYRFLSNSGNEKQIKIPFDEKLIPEGYTPNDIGAFTFDYQNKKWIRINIVDVDIEGEYVTINSRQGETDYVNGIIKNPESTDLTSFTPTTINDIPVANPTSKINMIAPPVANQQGSANLQYPIEIPLGRSGLQPQITVTYNSDIKTGGWLGVGWDIPLETIEIDTRWGVPLFSSTKETEIYTINGEQLVFKDDYLPNKTPEAFWENRNSSGNRQFYFRTGVKDGIIITRKGTTSKAYTWEIKDNNGNTKVYDTFLRDKIESDNSGNIVKWFLTKVTDKYGNTIVYNYTDVGDLATGKNKYLSSITYFKTTIEFTNQTVERHDATSNFKLGVNIAEKRLLSKIVVKRNSLPVRQYDFEYLTNQQTNFYKSLLSKIIQKDGSGNHFNEHKFSYNSYTGETFSDKKVIAVTSPNDGLSAGNFNEAKLSAISGNESKSENFKGALTFGVGGLKPLSFSKFKTAGMNYSYSENKNTGITQLMDMDGDGLPDKVFYKNNTIQYRKNIGNGFSSNLTIPIGLSNFPISKNNSYVNSYGFEVSFKVAQGGITYSTTKGNSPIYFTDINGDGLADMIYYGEVFFNKLRLQNNVPVNQFAKVTPQNTNALSDTPNAIIKGINAPNTTTPETESNLLANIVRVWEAPTTGTIKITNQITLNQTSTDGVKVWVEKGSLKRSTENNTSIPNSTPIGNPVTLTNQGQFTQQDIPPFLIEKGQRIYIIASSIDKADGDKVKVNSTIEYTFVNNVNDLSIKDANGYNYFKFNHAEAYLETSQKPSGVAEKGKVNINWSLLNDLTLTDDVDFKIYKLEKKALDTADISDDNKVLIYHHKLNYESNLQTVTPNSNQLGTSLNNILINQNSTDKDPSFTNFYFEVSADTNVAWDKINWKPSIETISESDTIVSKAYVNYKSFVENIKNNYHITKDNINYIGTNVQIPFKLFPKFTQNTTQSLNLNTSDFNGKKVVFSIKFIQFYAYCRSCGFPVKDHTFKKEVVINNGLLPIPYIEASNPLPLGPQEYNNVWPLESLLYDGLGGFDNVFFELTSDDYNLNKYLSTLNPNIFAENSGDPNRQRDLGVKPDYYSTRSNSKNYNPTVGNMWQGWGGFVYNGSKYPGQALKEQEFYITPPEEGTYVLPNCGDPGTETYEICMLNYVNQVAENRYFTSIEFEPKANGYVSPIESAFLDKDYLQPYKMYARIPSETHEGEPVFLTANPSGIISHSKGKSLNIYGGLGPVSGNGGFSNDDTNEHFQDFNGDGFPDIIVDNKYYKTNITGGLTSFVTIVGKSILNKSNNKGIGLSIAKSINPQKFSNNSTSSVNGFGFGEYNSHLGSSFFASGASFGLSLGSSGSDNKNLWMDVNGDGLVDYISGGQVFLNNGKDFVPNPQWSQSIGTNIFSSNSEAISGGGGVNFGQGSWVLGIGKNFSKSKNSVFFIDLTGDGLLDRLVKEGDKGRYALYANTGKGISSTGIEMNGKDFITESQQNGSGFNGFGTFCYNLIFKVCGSLGYGNERSANKQTIDLRDFDGDGLADLLLSSADNDLTVYPNILGEVNLLKQIENPLGGKIYLTYASKNPISNQKIGNTYQMPFTKNALVKVAYDTDSVLPEPLKSPTTDYRTVYYEYENGVQDRRERTFLGFGKIKTIGGNQGISEVTEYETNFTDAADFYVPYNGSSVRKYFYKKGLVKSSYILDSIGRERQRVNYTYKLFDQISTNYVLTSNLAEPLYRDLGRIIPFLYKTETITTEFSGTNSLSKTVVNTIEEYNKYGNVLRFKDWGINNSNTNDDLIVSIVYHDPIAALNIFGIPKQHLVQDFGNNVLRKSETGLSGNNKGDIGTIKRYIGSTFAEYKYTFDAYGNITKTELPLNTGQSASERMFFTYTYENIYNTYITKVTDANGYTSTTVYDDNCFFGLPKSSTDINGNTAYFTYDKFGRLTQYRSPVDTDWTIKLYYYKNENKNSKYAVTERKAPVINGVNPTLNYFSSILVDGLGDPVLNKKLYGGTNGNYIYTTYQEPIKDQKGRIIIRKVNKLATRESGEIMQNMQFSGAQNPEILNVEDLNNNYIIYKYDEMDRLTKTIQKGVKTDSGSQDLSSLTQYGFGTDRDGNAQFTTKTTSPKGVISTKFADAKGRITATNQIGDGKTLWTSYTYDLLSQLKEVKDQNLVKTEYAYDNLGRRILQKHPDAGQTNYQYDWNNNLLFMDNPVLRSLNKKIAYTYKFNRLSKITYPDHQVIYEYGAPNAADFGAGRLIKLTDHSGIQNFKYNKLGQTVEEQRILVAPNTAPKLFKTNYTYDIYNRINKITYPDNEEVFYNYNAFGFLQNITSKAPGSTSTAPIVSEISYNYNEQTTEILSGNGTKTKYKYDNWSQLEELALQGLTQELKKDIYTFDKDNNVKKIRTEVPMNGSVVLNNIGISSEKTYSYDGFNRINEATIQALSKTGKTYYKLGVQYNGVHGITDKNSQWKNFTSATCENPFVNGYKAKYIYDNNSHPNAVSTIEYNRAGNAFATPWDCGSPSTTRIIPMVSKFSYDDNGNTTKAQEEVLTVGGSTGEEPAIINTKQFFWDAENRLKGMSEKKALHHYVYDAHAQRALKSEGTSKSLAVDGNLQPSAEPTVIGPYTYYPNEYMVFSNKLLTKHYYIGSNKIAARVSAAPTNIFEISATGELQTLSGILKTEIETIASQAQLQPIAWPSNASGNTGIEESEGLCEIEVLRLAEGFRNTACYNKIMAGYTSAFGANTGMCNFLDAFKLDDCMINHPTEQQSYQTYWLHPDHLGSSSVITNQSGNTTNWYEYMPFGEMLIEQSNNQYNNVFKYNGKELDDATGLYYYGARYYDPNTSIWLNVDPLAVYNPVMESQFYGDGQHNGGVYNAGNLNPYIYCYQNPIVYVDPNGKQNYFMTPTSTYSSKNTTFLPAKVRTAGFAFRNPWAAARIGEYKRGSDNISSISTRFGTTGGILDLNTDSKGRSFDEGSERGAFRHTVWQAQITREFGADIAKQAGNSHEDNPNVDLSVRSFDNLADADQTVDLLNNIIGRRIGSEKGISNLAEDVLEEFKTNGLYQAKQNKDGTWSVNKQKLSPAKYQQYKQRLNDMNYKGRTSEEQKKVK